MAFWDAYKRSLKPLEVEEPIDVYVHRPLAFLLARAALPTPVSPNAITLGSIAFGFVAGACILVAFPGHLLYAGAAIFLSAVFDCADGQLARMRGTSSPLGRMLDGCADLVVSAVIVSGGTYLVWRHYAEPAWLGLLAIAMCLATIVTSSFHTSLYDHYKNVFLRFTHPTYREGEDYFVALARRRQTRAGEPAWMHWAWGAYLYYVRSQAESVRRFDPYTWDSLGSVPEYDGARAARYREHAGKLMRVWRTFFGFGSLVFGISVSVAFDVVEYYMLFRLLALNGIFYGYLRPKQRAASRAARAELAPEAAPSGVALPVESAV